MTFILTTQAKWLRVAVFAMLFMLIPQFIDWAYVKLIPQTFWVEYSKLVVVDNVYATDGKIEVFSFAEIKRPVHIEWNDTLLCSHAGGDEFVTSMNTSKTYSEPQSLPRSEKNAQGELVDVPWRFPTEGKLVAGEKCFIQSNVTAVVKGEKKEGQTLNSNTFTIRYGN